MMQPLLRHQIYEADKGRTFGKDDEVVQMAAEHGDTNQKEIDKDGAGTEDSKQKEKRHRINSEGFHKAEPAAVGNAEFRFERKKSSEDREEVRSEVSDGSELLNVDEESNQSAEFQKSSNLSPVDLTNRSLELDRNRFKFNALLLRNRTLFNNCPDFRENVNFFAGAKFQLKEDNYENGGVNPAFYDRGLDKEFGSVSDRFRERFFKIEDVRHFNSEKLFLNGKVKDVEERSESVSSNLSASSTQDLNGSVSHFRRDDKTKLKAHDKSQNFVPFQRFNNYSPDGKSSSPVGEPCQPVSRRNLAFSVENILDPNKFTGSSPSKFGNDANNLAALVTGQRLQSQLGNVVAPVGCCWRPHIQDGGESDRDDNSGTFTQHFKTTACHIYIP